MLLRQVLIYDKYIINIPSFFRRFVFDGDDTYPNDDVDEFPLDISRTSWLLVVTAGLFPSEALASTIALVLIAIEYLPLRTPD
jgi:hypothetical protein